MAVERRERLSAILRDICDDPDPRVTIGEMIHRFGPRAFGALLFVFAIPNLLPLPPGSTTVLGLPLVILAPQVAVGVHGPWLPRWLDERSLSRANLRSAFAKVLPTLDRIERFSKPRMLWMFGPVGDRLIGVVCTLLALALILPIPLGNLLPAAIIALFGLTLILRDGLLALITYALTGLGAGLIFIGARAGLAAIGHLIERIWGVV